MKHNAYIIFTLIVVACITSLGIQAAQPPLIPPPQPVTVVNDEAHPVPVIIQDLVRVNTRPYRFVGFSTDTANGGQGPIVMNGKCQDDFGDEARMCDTKDYFDTPIRNPAIITTGWIRPHIVSRYFDPEVGEQSVLVYPDYEQFGTVFDVLTCAQWVSEGGSRTGTIISTIGEFDDDGINDVVGKAGCIVELPIVCCAPQ